MERDEGYWLRGTITMLEATVDGLEYELRMRDIRLAEQAKYIAELERRVEELKKQAIPVAAPAAALPAFVKLDLPRRRKKKPGRKDGHEAALRPMPAKIDHHQDVPLPMDRSRRRAVCPHCKCPLTRLRRRKRIVEDLVPSAVETTCYHTRSGYCPHCRKSVESRAPEQPPAANIPHGQLGINALATVAILRVRHRLGVPADRSVAQGHAGLGNQWRRIGQADQAIEPLARRQVPGPDPPDARQRARACR